jgi:hypothetical protein
MAAKLPAWIEVRRDLITESWFMRCRACGIRDRYDKFWSASRAAYDHADFHYQDEAGRVGGS